MSNYKLTYMVLNQLNLVSSDRHTAYLFNKSGYEEVSGKGQLQRKLQTILDHKPSINALRNPQRRVLALYFWISTTLITATSSFLITLAHLITKENDTYLAHKIATL